MSSTISTDTMKLTNPLNEIYGGTNQSTYTTGDILYASGTNQLSKLAIGSTGYVLTSTGTVPVYSPLIPTSETLNVSNISTPITPNIDYTFLNYTTTGTVEWAARIAGGSSDFGYSITTDSTGMYVLGNSFSKPVTIYNSNGISFDTLVNPGDNIACIVKYNTSGFVQWTVRIAGNGSTTGVGITAYSSGIYVTGGYLNSPVTFYNSNNTVFQTLPNPSSGAQDAFIVKYNSSGFGQWAARISGTNTSEAGLSVVADLTGVYVAGDYTLGSITIYNSDTSSFGTLSFSGANDGFIVKYNISGFAQWATRIAGAGIDVPYSITIDSTGVYVSGYYSSNPVTIYNSNATSFGTLANSGNNDTFLVKYNTSGFAQWATRIAGTGDDQSYSVTTDSTGVYVSGYYSSNPVTIYNSNAIAFGTLVNSGNYDAFLVKYNTSGFAQWATRIAGTGDDRCYSVAADLTGVYVTGYYSSNPVTIYNSDTSIFGTLVSSGSSNAFIVKYNTSGFCQWSSRIGGAVVFSGGGGYSITADSTGVYVTGYYDSNPVTIYNSNGTPFETLVNSGSNDIFIVKYISQINLASLANRTFIGSKVISMLNDGVINVTVSNLVYDGIPMTTLTFNSQKESIRLGWNGTYWFVISTDGVVIS